LFIYLYACLFVCLYFLCLSVGLSFCSFLSFCPFYIILPIYPFLSFLSFDHFTILPFLYHFVLLYIILPLFIILPFLLFLSFLSFCPSYHFYFSKYIFLNFLFSKHQMHKIGDIKNYTKINIIHWYIINLKNIKD